MVERVGVAEGVVEGTMEGALLMVGSELGASEGTMVGEQVRRGDDFDNLELLDLDLDVLDLEDSLQEFRLSRCRRDRFIR